MRHSEFLQDVCTSDGKEGSRKKRVSFIVDKIVVEQYLKIKNFCQNYIVLANIVLLEIAYDSKRDCIKK